MGAVWWVKVGGGVGLKARPDCAKRGGSMEGTLPLLHFCHLLYKEPWKMVQILRHLLLIRDTAVSEKFCSDWFLAHEINHLTEPEQS